MPNHIKNRIVIHGTPEQVQEVFNKYNTHVPASLRKAHSGEIICEKINTKEFSVGWLNLNTGEFSRREEPTVIGLPDGWEPEIKQAIDVFPDFEKIIPPPNNDAYNDIPNQHSVRNSPDNWYNWNIKNWGTKWNSYDHEKENYNSFTFETAWSGVPDLILTLSKQTPGIEFTYEYADEDTGNNCAAYKFKSGEVLEKSEPVNGTSEAYKLAFKLRPEIEKEYVLAEGEYKYKED